MWSHVYFIKRVHLVQCQWAPTRQAWSCPLRSIHTLFGCFVPRTVPDPTSDMTQETKTQHCLPPSSLCRIGNRSVRSAWTSDHKLRPRSTTHMVICTRLRSLIEARSRRFGCDRVGGGNGHVTYVSRTCQFGFCDCERLSSFVCDFSFATCARALCFRLTFGHQIRLISVLNRL